MVDIYYSRIACNTYVMYNDNGEGFLVDPGWNNNNCLIDHLTKLNVNIKAILLTHGHFDHIYALKDILNVYKDAKVYVSASEEEFLSNPELNLSFNDEIECLSPLSFVPKNLFLVEDNEIINVCNFNIKVIHTPFHTKGSVCYYVEDEKALFSGDTLFFTTIGRTDLPTGSSKTVVSSLEKLVKLPEGIKVYPGHGPVTNLDREKKYNSYLKNI